LFHEFGYLGFGKRVFLEVLRGQSHVLPVVFQVEELHGLLVVPLHDVARGVDEEQGVGRIFEHFVQQAFAHSHPFLGLLAFGNVEDKGHALVSKPFQRGRPHQHRQAGAVLADEFLFEGSAHAHFGQVPERLGVAFGVPGRGHGYPVDLACRSSWRV
jgi:hypothetical protein